MVQVRGPVRQWLLAGPVLLAVVILAVVTIPAARADHRLGYSWPPGSRVLRLEDRTGFADWQQAEQTAVSEWNAGQSGISVYWTDQASFSGDEYCGMHGTTISVCRGHIRSRGWQGVTWFDTDGADHFASAYIVVDDRPFSQDQEVNILCHEIGHVLGLDEQTNTDSCMSDPGDRAYPTAPDQSDYDDLRAIYASSSG